jgi:O-antigen/teichoic acid export membrane protein
MAILSVKNLQSISPRSWLRKGSFGAHVLTLTTGTGLAHGFTIIATLILARLFSPADFGALALFVAITSILSAVGSWRYDAAIMLPERHEDAANVQALAFLILIGMCGLSLLGVAMFRHPIAARLLGEERFASWLWGVPVSLFWLGLFQIFATWSSRMKQFQRLAIANVSQSLGTFAGQLGLVTAGLGGPEALVSGWIAGQAVGTLVLGGQVLREYGGFWKKSWDWASVRAGFVKYRNFPIYNSPYLLAQTVADQCVFLALRIFASVHVVGLFSMARRAVLAPVTLLTSSAQQVFYEKAATQLKSSRLEPFVLRILRLQVAIGTPVLVLFAFEAKWLFRLILGSAWAEVGLYAAMLAFLGYAYFVTAWMERIFDVQGRQKIALIWELARDFVVIGGLAAVLVLTRNPVLAIGTYVGLDILSLVVWLTVAFRIAHFAVENLWQIGAVGLGTGSAAAVVLWAIHAVFQTW